MLKVYGQAFLICLLAFTLSSCISQRGVVKPQTATEHALVVAGEAFGALMLAYDDVVSLYESDKITQTKANAKLDDLDRYLADIKAAKRLIQTGGSLREAQDKISKARAFLVQLKGFLDQLKGG